MAMGPNLGPGQGAVRLIVNEAGKTRYFYTTLIPSLVKSLECERERGVFATPWSKYDNLLLKILLNEVKRCALYLHYSLQNHHIWAEVEHTCKNKQGTGLLH